MEQTQSNNTYLEHLRHSAAHLLAAAVLDLYPETKNTIGPVIENGFYYDFDFKEPIKEEDLKEVEKRMSQLLSNWIEFTHKEISPEEAKKIFAHNPYKLELIDEFVKEGKTLSLYESGGFIDLCKGGHVEHPSEELKAFKLLSIAGAYWRGNEKNKMLTRIYGTAFPTQDELDNYLQKLTEIEKRDHKKLGRELDLFTFSETVGKGLPLWTEKGATIRRILERFITDEEIKRGYKHVITPDIASLELYKKSGHYPYYKESMYAPIQIEDEEYMLRPMTCPHHFELYLSKPHSYKELPIRYAELAKLYRYEKSGELMGLLRVRAFTLADAHIIARPDQAKAEIGGALELIEYLASVFHLKAGGDYYYRLSLGDRNDEKKYYKDDKAWNEAENILRDVLKSRSVPFVEANGEAAFYGPKIDIQMKNIHGKEDTAFTVQYDFVMPKRFHLNYINEAGREEEAIVVHRSSIGAIERLIAFLIEHFSGAFPLWLSPIQVEIVPVSDKSNKYAEVINIKLREKDIRADADLRNEKMQGKIRDAQLMKIPYMAIVGGREEENNTVSIRTREGKDLGAVPLNKFIDQLQTEIESKN